MQGTAHRQAVARRTTFSEGLYSGLVVSPPISSSSSSNPQTVAEQRDAKLQLLVEAPAAVEDALASLVNHVDPEVQVCPQLGTSMVPALYQYCTCPDLQTCVVRSSLQSMVHGDCCFNAIGVVMSCQY